MHRNSIARSNKWRLFLVLENANKKIIINFSMFTSLVVLLFGKKKKQSVNFIKFE
jgi:hypothetical protein